MELLTNLLLNQFAGNNSATNLKGDSQSDFSQYFSQANNKNTQNDNYSKKNDTSKDKSYDSSNKDDNKYDNSKKDKSSSTSETKKSDNKSTKSKDDDDTKVKPKDNVILIDQAMLNELAQVLDIPVDAVLGALEELSMSISMLEDSENLLQFVQTALGIEDSKDLLFVDDLSGILDEITQIAQSVTFTDIGSASSIFSQFLNKEDLSNLTIIGDDIDAEALTQIKELLGELNGEIIETKMSKREINQELLKEEMKEEALLQNQVSQNKTQIQQQLKPKVNSTEINQDLSQNLTVEVDIEDSEAIFFNKDLKLDKNEFKQDLKVAVDLNPKVEVEVLDENNLNSNSNSNSDMQQQSQQQSQQQTYSNTTSSSSSSTQQASQATTTTTSSNVSTNESQALTFDATFNLGGKVNNSSLVSSSQTTQGMTSNQVMAQILDKMRNNIQEDITEVKITLKPAHLGDLTLKIITEEGTITAQFLAENEKIKELIEANFDSLKDILSEKGIEVGGLEVNVSDKEAGQEYQTGEAFKFLQDNQVDEDLLESLLEEEEQKESIIQDDSSSVSYSA